MFKNALLTGLIFGIASLTSYAQAEEVCGRIRSATYIENSNGVEAIVNLDRIHGRKSHATLATAKIKLLDVTAVYKISKVISLLSIQNSQQLQQDLSEKNFDWYFLVGHEKSTNPYEEDFSVCIDADMATVTQRNELHSIHEIIDIFEDGYSVKDLL